MMSLEGDDNKFGFYISYINKAAKGYFSRELKLYNLGPGQQAYLLALQPEESIPQEQLAERLRVDKANVSRAVKGLLSLGYIQRIQSDDDQRVCLISLSPSGLQCREEVITIAAAWVEKLKSGLSREEWKHSLQGLEKIAMGLMEQD